MSAINSLLRPLFDAMLAPFSELPAMVTLVPIALIIGILMLLVFKWTSRQEALDRVKRRTHAGFFEIRLWSDDLRAIFAAQWEILKATGRYIALSLVPMLFILPPLVLILGQLEYHYGYRALEPGETTLLTVQLDDTARATRPEVTLQAPPGVEVEKPPVWIPSLGQFIWELRARQPGRYELALNMAGAATIKQVVAGDEVLRVSPKKPAPSFWEQLLWTAEPPTDGALIQSIRLDYPGREVNLLGWNTHWIIAFFILSVVAILLLRKPLGVTI